MSYYLGYVNTESNHKSNLSMEKVIAITIANRNHNHSVEKSFKHEKNAFALAVDPDGRWYIHQVVKELDKKPH